MQDTTTVLTKTKFFVTAHKCKFIFSSQSTRISKVILLDELFLKQVNLALL